MVPSGGSCLSIPQLMTMPPRAEALTVDLHETGPAVFSNLLGTEPARGRNHPKEVFEIINALPEQRIFLRAGMRSTVIWKRCQSVKPILAAQRNPKRSS